MSHNLPSGRHLADIHGFFWRANLINDGSTVLQFKVPPEMAAEIHKIHQNDGLALNISVWETTMPTGDEWLARALGMGMEVLDVDEGTKPTKKTL